MHNNKLVHFRLPPDLHKALKVRAAMEDTTLSALAAAAIRAFLKKGGRRGTRA